MRHFILICFVNIFCIALESDPDRNITCGIDLADKEDYLDETEPMMTESMRSLWELDINYYPWFGVVTDLKDSEVRTVGIMVTKQLVICSALEIDKIPKEHFRQRTRFVIPDNFSTEPDNIPRVIRVRDYVYHPEYEVNTYSSLALVQLDVDDVTFDLFHICGPPTHFVDTRFHAIVIVPLDSDKYTAMLYEMEYVDINECRWFYRRSGLDVRSLWPTYATCARAKRFDEDTCVWPWGTALVTKMGDRWHLLGFGVEGPGCREPARFLDYGPFVTWVRANVENIGKPAVTRVGPGHIILRRKLSNLQRFGPCDPEETTSELYTDTITYVDSVETRNRLRTIRYNVTLADSVEYSCVTFKVYNKRLSGYPPLLRLRRWCARPRGLCSGFQAIRIDFYIEIEFVGTITFKLAAYGREVRGIDVRYAMVFVNRNVRRPPIKDSGADGSVFW